MEKVDPLGYYAALNLSHGAGLEEVRLAYRFLKEKYLEDRSKKIDIQTVRTAYQTLGDPKRKNAYDRGDIDGARQGVAAVAVPRRPFSEVWRTYAVVAGVVIALILGTTVSYHNAHAIRGWLTHFEPGATIYERGASHPWGTIERYDPNHAFPKDKYFPAYLVRPADGGAPRWYPEHDLDPYFETR